MTYTLANHDPFNGLDIGSLSVPLVFQVTLRCSCAVHCHPVSPYETEPMERLRQHVMCIGIPSLGPDVVTVQSKNDAQSTVFGLQSNPHRSPDQLTSRSLSLACGLAWQAWRTPLRCCPAKRGHSHAKLARHLQGRWDGLTLDQMADELTFTDFHLGLQHGWASVTRATGAGPVLLMVPEHGASFEAWQSRREDAAGAGPLWTPALMLHSRAHRVRGSQVLRSFMLRCAESPSSSTQRRTGYANRTHTGAAELDAETCWDFQRLEGNTLCIEMCRLCLDVRTCSLWSPAVQTHPQAPCSALQCFYRLCQASPHGH